MLISERSQLTQPQSRKIDRILASAPSAADALLIEPVALADMAPETVCLSILAHMSKRGEFVEPKACFIDPTGRHRWLSNR